METQTRTKRTQPPLFRPMSVVAKWLDGSRCHSARRCDTISNFLQCNAQLPSETSIPPSSVLFCTPYSVGLSFSYQVAASALSQRRFAVVPNRVGSVWIFQIRFYSVRFSISSTRFRFFSVSVFAHHHNARVF